MAIEQSQISCGVFELFNLTQYTISVKETSAGAIMERTLIPIEKILCTTFFQCEDCNDVGQCAFIIFSDVHDSMNKRGEEYADFIEENNLGTVHRSVLKRNPNSSNRIRVYLWSVDWDRYSKWAMKQ